MLDNIGIIVKADEAYTSYALKLGVTADKLTDAQKKQAFLEATMESARAKVAQLGEETLSSQDSFDAFTATVMDLSVALGDHLKGAFTGAMDAFVEFVNVNKKADVDSALASKSVVSLSMAIKQVKNELEPLQARLNLNDGGIVPTDAINAVDGTSEKVKILTFQLGALERALAAATSVVPSEGFMQTDEASPIMQNFGIELDFVSHRFMDFSEELVPNYIAAVQSASNITADYSDNLGVLARAFKISSIAQEQQTGAIVENSFATALAYDNAGKAAEAAGRDIIQSLIKTATVRLMEDAVAKLGWIGVPLAATAGAVVGSLVGQAGRHWNMNKFEQGGLVGGRRHSQGGTMIEAEQGEFVMSRNAVNAVGIEAMNRINQGGGAGSVNISFSGNVMSQDFIEGEAIPMIKEAIRRGADIGVS
tara:strand:- start:38 stop:1303 length:1266 start_codon:yes stop_codon:yes gene_type:complete